LINSIDSIKDDPDSRIIVIPFHEHLFDPIEGSASKKDKQQIKEEIKRFSYRTHRDINLELPLSKFKTLVEKNTLDYINYMFLYTDGLHEIDGKKDKDAITITSKIIELDEYVKNNYIYRFYFEVDQAAHHDNIMALESDDRRFWVIRDYKVNIKFVGLSSIRDTLDVCNDSIIKIDLTKDCKDFKGKITFKANESKFYKVECVTSEDNSSLNITVTPKPGVSIPEKETIKIRGKLEKNENDKEQKYFYLLDSQLEIVCNYDPEEVLIGLDTSEIEYNLSDNYKDGKKKDSVKTISLLKQSNEFNGEIIFEAVENGLYDVSCNVLDDKSHLEVVVTPKKDVSSCDKEKETIEIKCKLYEREKDFRKRFKLRNENITINCVNLPKRTVNFCLENQKGLKSYAKKTLDLGATSYYPGFWGKSDSLSCLKFSLLTSFDEAAKSNNASCKLSFCDDNGNSLSYSDFKIVVNGKDTPTNSYVLDSKCEKVDFEIVPSKSAKDFTFNGYIIISDVKNADEVNGCKATESIKILPWRYEHDRIPDPLEIFLKFLLLLLILAGLLLKIIRFCLRKNAPTFPDNKIMVFENEDNEYLFDNPKLTMDVILEGNNSPLIVKGYSNIYIAHSKQRNGYLKQLILTDKKDWTSSKNFWGGWTYMIGANLPRKIRQITISPLNKDSLKLNIFYVGRSKEEEMTLNYEQIENSNIPYTCIGIHFTNGVINNINN
jgi:hypothetical protein